MKSRFKEHSAYLRLNRTQKFSLAKHSWKASHPIFLDKAKIIDKVDHYNKRKVLKYFEIELQPTNINRDDDVKVSKSWEPLVYDLRKKVTHIPS